MVEPIFLLHGAVGVTIGRILDARAESQLDAGTALVLFFQPSQTVPAANVIYINDVIKI